MMTCVPQVWVLALLSLRGIFSRVLTERLNLQEGQNLDLYCVNNRGNTSALEWKDPRGFAIFFNGWQVTRDGRYELLRYSNDSLSIRLSNITRHDEGLFTCLYYSDTIGSKLVSVTVWAPPSKPLLEVLRTPEKHTEENLVLRCSTDDSWPAPQITWLLQNGVEIFGNAQHQLEAKRFCSISNLTIYAFPQGSIISCVIHHKALGRRNLTVTLHLDHAKQKQKTEETFSIPTLSPTREAETQSSNAINESNPIFNMTEGNPTTQTPFPSNPIFNMTEGNPTTQTSYRETNMTYKGFMEGQAIFLFPGLVSMLLLALFIVVFLFVVKLWKAHRDWKKENNPSEQTIESFRPKANEAPCRLKKNICTIPWRINEKYVIQESSTRTPKPSEESQDSSVFEKEFSHFKETDL
ncbi:cytotoxic and regulatory T-cell molecule isoform X1 [Crotalus tigris]|uniref:cytotoxic and regulatory T-cell molecule isoform X1 n=1 Tax=Crotalus tigris TaxID=88082 RepID=UPI00192F3BAF|nr:cytotoxic and regulatory T-cell molecule isoform X1 [Crotalus tigris]